MHTARSAMRTCSACSSAVEYTATASTSSSWSARMMRTAISPRLATRTRLNTVAAYWRAWRVQGAGPRRASLRGPDRRSMQAAGRGPASLGGFNGGVSSARIAAEIARHEWWHTIEVAPGVVTRGGWDLRPTAERIPWPPSLVGLRCLDIGTFDGFWAFELERRGAAEVVAFDLPDLGAGDARHPFARARSGRPLGETFRVAAEALGSRASYGHRDVYDLS